MADGAKKKAVRLAKCRNSPSAQNGTRVKSRVGCLRLTHTCALALRRLTNGDDLKRDLSQEQWRCRKVEVAQQDGVLAVGVQAAVSEMTLGIEGREEVRVVRGTQAGVARCTGVLA